MTKGDCFVIGIFVGMVLMIIGLWLRMLDEAPTVSGWVNVKDELPEEDTDVLVWNNLGMEIAAYTTNPVKRWYSYTGQEVFVKYWMPLPEPPEVNGDG